ncbi:amidohydrolase [Vagococcus carniphilus]|uniref:Amidohydrolase n=1 Tax=Vagococcus carniphilus TaxID=218144 RepID=A0AAW8U4S0_9ENTE|nr:amidohydrolase [Vagococcus carniphilus]MDT2833806.1 amidohydrolase [Vagococcus carniphilus]
MNQLIKNVRLEVSYNYDDNQIVTKTNTEIFDVLIKNGVISKIDKNIDCRDATIIDAKQQLMIPAFKEMHTHLDKTYFGGEWIAPMPAEDGVFSRIKEEEVLLKDLESVTEERARHLIKHYISLGHTHIRTHVNVDPTVGISHVELITKLLKEYDDVITYEIVAFPQHGLYRNGQDFITLFEQALSLGVTHVGGLDPAMVDKNIHQSLDTIVSLAKKYDLGIDIHLHDADTLGLFEIHHLLDLVEQYDFTNNITLSHVFALAGISDEELKKLSERMKKHNVLIASTVAIGEAPITLPIFDLGRYGVKVAVVHDSLIDHWSPFGSGDTIRKLNALAQRFGLIDEYNLSQTLKFSNGGINLLDEKGQMMWPKVGDEANLLLVDAISSAHMIARRAPISTVISRGNILKAEELELKGGYWG